MIFLLSCACGWVVTPRLKRGAMVPTPVPKEAACNAPLWRPRAKRASAQRFGSQ